MRSASKPAPEFSIELRTRTTSEQVLLEVLAVVPDDRDPRGAREVSKTLAYTHEQFSALNNYQVRARLKRLRAALLEDLEIRGLVPDGWSP